MKQARSTWLSSHVNHMHAPAEKRRRRPPKATHSLWPVKCCTRVTNCRYCSSFWEHVDTLTRVPIDESQEQYTLTSPPNHTNNFASEAILLMMLLQDLGIMQSLQGKVPHRHRSFYEISKLSKLGDYKRKFSPTSVKICSPSEQRSKT